MHFKWLFYLILFCLLQLTCKTQNSKAVSKTVPEKKAINLCGPTVADLNTEPGYDGRLSPIFEGLNVYHYPISTSSKEAQQYFDQGLVLSYGFNHAEAARSFREAIRQDPECAICYWGLAYVLGPNYNAGMEMDVLPAANEAIANAKMYIHKASAKEKKLINAIAQRYPKIKDIDPAPYYENYAKAMREAAQLYSEDVDIVVMAAEALMDLHPWDLWQKNGTPQPWTPEILALIESALQKNPDHPQGMHLYIHAMEAAPNPEKALKAANRLRFRVPGSGHLLHMPSHLYINVGMYHEGSEANERAVKQDSMYVEACGVAGIYPLAYYPHNWHFLAACAALEGRGERALEASRYMADFVVDKKIMREPSLATLQHYYTIPWYIMVKFAMWDEILAETPPEADLTYPMAIWHYARAMASAAKGNLPEAKKSLAYISEVEKDSLLNELTVWDINKIVDLVKIAREVVRGEIALQSKAIDKAILHFKQAIEMEDMLNYNEPPDWFFSVRHLLGNALLKAGRYAEAEQVYQKDLQNLKDNGWALMGLYKSLTKQGKAGEAAKVKLRFDQAWQYADVELLSSVL